MSDTFLDRASGKSRLFSRIAKDRIDRFFSLSAAANMLCCAAGTLAAGIISETGGVPYYAAFAVMLIVWAQAAVLSGFRRHWFFMSFSAAMWLLPRLFISATQSVTQNAELIPLNNALADISALITDGALALPNRFTEYSDVICAVIFILLYFIGLRARSAAKRSDFYCRTRLEQLERS